MSNTKKRRNIEIYEDYWKFTAALTNIYGNKFKNALSVIVNYIDANKESLEKNAKAENNFNDSPLYKNLQKRIAEMMSFQGPDATLSARKVINLYVKIGFVFPFLVGYHPLVKKYLRAESREQKKAIFSRIFYENSSLASGTTKDNSHLKHVSFFLQTLDYNKTLSNEDLTALMVTDITLYKAGYMTRAQLDEQYRYAKVNHFENRKYNQISHLIAYLKNFTDLKYDKDEGRFWFADDPTIADKEFDQTYPRDSIKHRLYKKDLKAEAESLYGEVVCFFDKKPHKVLIASHIKPYKQCMKEGNEKEAYDPENGILLNQEVDSYFDKFEVTFLDGGEIMVSDKVPQSIRVEFEKNRLDPQVLTETRKKYLSYHRKLFNERNGK
jgi:hypothetical protein